jgi:hypothetical protein
MDITTAKAEIIIQQGYIPIILNYFNESKNEIFKNELIKNISPEITIGQFLYHIRSRIARIDKKSITEIDGFYIMIKDESTLPLANLTIKNIYDKYKNKDKYLYLIICKEHTFGNALFSCKNT